MRARIAILLSFCLLLFLAGCVAVPTDEEFAVLQGSAVPPPPPTATSTSPAAAATKTSEPTAVPQSATAISEALRPTNTATATVSPTIAPALVAPATTTRAATVAVPSESGTAMTGTRTFLPSAAAQPTAVITATRTPTPTVVLTTTAALTATYTITNTPPIAIAITATLPVTAELKSATTNLRGGPGTEFDVVSTAAQGTRLPVIGRNADGSWWQVCCVDDKPVWVNDSVVTILGARDVVPVRSPLMPDKLEATWAIHWVCSAEGCPQPECFGESKAQTLQVRDTRWLEVKREATWPDQCGKKEDWLVQVDRYSGQETQAPTDPPLFYMWMGANPGPENRTMEHLGRTLSLWCTDTRTREVKQAGGWTVVIEGQACYDRGSGVLVTMEYSKRWLFTGTNNGKKYERQYFGDNEVYQQILTGTNIPMSAK
jgi:SH3-like domain-containing protein